MRILHLIDALDSPPTPVTLASLAALIAHATPALQSVVAADEYPRALASPLRQAVCALGPADLLDLAAQSDLPLDAYLPCGRGQSWRAAWVLRRYLREIGHASFDLIHAWSSAAGLIAARLVGSPRVLVSVPGPSHISRAIVSRRVAVHTPAMFLPGLDAARLQPSHRQSLRTRWGVMDDQTLVVAVLGDDVSRIDSMLGMIGVGLGKEAGRMVRVLMTDRAAGLHRAQHVTDAAGRPHLIIRDRAAERPWEVLPGCDMAVVMDGHLSGAWCLAAGVPVIAPICDESRRVFTDATAVLTRPHSMGDIGRVVCELFDDAARRRAMSHAALALASERFSLATYAQRMRQLYHDVLTGCSSTLPQPASITSASAIAQSA